MRVDVADVLRVAAPRRFSASRMQRAAPSPSGAGCGHVVRVGVGAVADELRQDVRAPRAWRAPAPRAPRCPRPRPRRSRRGPCRRGGWRRAGSSLRVDSAFIAANPPMPSGVMAASAPPAIIASVSPRGWTSTPRRWRARWSSTRTPATSSGPWRRTRMVISPGAMLMIIWRMKNGERRSKPFSSAFLCCSSSEPSPPMPGADDDAHLLGVVAVRLVRADRQAALLHRHLGGRQRVLREEVHPAGLPCRSMNCSGSKSFTSPAMRGVELARRRTG